MECDFSIHLRSIIHVGRITSRTPYVGRPSEPHHDHTNRNYCHHNDNSQGDPHRQSNSQPQSLPAVPTVSCTWR